ncbi:MAG: hypothetical protein JW931_07980 [Methanomicrobiaceae archaeon]|nr:hypothetical protein [Methanomicrobiaceae archaeon]
MEDSFGIYTTDGERLSGSLYDESITGLAERLDESTASLFIRTAGEMVYLGTAINVQKQGRRPDTFIYIERMSWHGSLPPRIDLSYIHEFYTRVADRLSSIDYGIRDLASDTAFIGDRRERFISGLSGTDVVEYALGKTLLCREVICVSEDLSKSVDFVVAIAEKLSAFLYAGFTIVVSKRSFKGADILVTEKSAGSADIRLETETISDTKWSDIYRTAGILPQRPEMAHWAAVSRTRRQIAEKLLGDLKKHAKASGAKSSYLDSFIESEEIEKFRCAETETARAAVSGTAAAKTSRRPAPSEEDYGKWEVSDYDRMKLMEDYSRIMEQKRKNRIRIIAAVAAVLLLAAAAVFIAAGPFGILKPVDATPTATPYITPSATIVPQEGNITIERLIASPGNIPAGLKGVSSAYNITPEKPRTILIELSENYDPLLPYYLMKFNTTGYSWDFVAGTSEYSGEGAKVEISEPGIYRIFTTRSAGETNFTHTAGGA